MHAGVTGQRSRRGQIITPQDSRDDPVPVHFSDHSPVHEVDQSVLIDCDS